MMKKNIKTEADAVQIEALSHDGRGVTTIGNRKAFIRGALPGETAKYTITRRRSALIEAETSEILTFSANRATPPCRHFGVCGGCSLQHMTIETQINLKQETLLNQLTHFGKVTPATVRSPISASHVGYRRKARLGVRFVYKKNKLLVGFRERASRYLADIESCAVLHPMIGEKLGALSECILQLAMYDQIPQVEVAIGDQDAALIFRHLVPCTPEDKEKLIAFGKAHEFHIFLQPNPPLPIEKIWPDEEPSRLSYTLPAYGLTYRFHPLDFTQINLEMNRLMVSHALESLALTPTDTVLDLFCGIGNFTLPIAQLAQSVTGIEGSEEMVERAYENAKLNGIANAEFYAADLTKTSSAPWIKSYDKVLLDPPRTGAKEILSIIKDIQPKKLVYVSCNPATLARDAGTLVHEYGYTFCEVGIMNMFPHTTHIEALAVFEKN